MTRIKVVPNATPNADGEWIECPFELPAKCRWIHMESMVAPLVPAEHHVVQVECGSRNVSPLSQTLLSFKR